MENRKYPERWFWHTLAMPFIYVGIIPLLIFHFYLEIYHQICFRLYSLPLVKTGEYIKIDRYKLEYLPWYEKINCAYCGYGNGLVHYASEILARTEKFWCGIKHAQYKNFKAPFHHQDFMEYGDKQAYKKIKPNKKNAS